MEGRKHAANGVMFEVDSSRTKAFGTGCHKIFFNTRWKQDPILLNDDELRELAKVLNWAVANLDNKEVISHDMTRLENLLSNLARDVGKLTLKTDVMDQQLTKMKKEIMALQDAPPTELQFRRSYTYGERLTCLEANLRKETAFRKQTVDECYKKLGSLSLEFQKTVGPATDKATTAAMKVERFDASIKILEEKVKELVAWTHLEEVKTGEDDPDYS